MENFWKWLMKTDARSLFIFSVVLLAAVTAWRAIDVVMASRAAARENTPSATGKPFSFGTLTDSENGDGKTASAETPLDLAPFKPIGIMNFIKKQFAPETLIVPVNPFHPTFEEIVKSIIKQSDSNVIELIDADGNKVQVHFEGTKLVDAQGNEVANPFQRDLTKPGDRPHSAANGQGHGQHQGQHQPPPAWQPVENRPQPGARPAPPKPRVAFKGVMQRPDGQFAAYVSDTMGPSRFVVVGDRVRNSTVTAAGRDGVELKLDDGTVATLKLGGEPLTLENGGAQ